MDNDWCLYIHTNKINNKKYIGISRHPKSRWDNGRGYHTQLFGYAIKKYGWDNFEHEIVFTDLNKDEACQKEIEFISKYNTTDRNFGYNVLPGGDVSGYAFNAKKVYQYTLNGDYVGEYNSIADAERCVGAGVSGCIHGTARTAFNYQWFDEYKGKKTLPRLSRVEAIIASQNKPVYKYSMNGEFLQKYNSITEAAEQNNIERTGISNCINGKSRSHKGFRWLSHYNGDTIAAIEEYKNKPQKIYQYSLDDEYINCYESIRAASRAVGGRLFLGNSNISQGYKWYFSPLESEGCA